jgi:hypothetical protein
MFFPGFVGSAPGEYAGQDVKRFLDNDIQFLLDNKHRILYFS